jgi:hypothetical protein
LSKPDSTNRPSSSGRTECWDWPCSSLPAPPPLAHGGDAICKADGLADLVGKSATADLGAEALSRSGARTLRWIQPGTMVTMDYRQDRLDVHLDEHNVVTRLSCG